MYGSLLSVLLMGMLPVSSAPSPDQMALSSLTIAAPLPATSSASTLLTIPQRVSASGVLISDLESSQTLLEVRPDTTRPMGSLTKLMTALIIAENHSMREVVTIPDGIEKTQGSVAHLRSGERYTVGDLLTALLVASANDAARSLATFHAGSVDAFVGQMNLRAQSLGLKHTSYANPDGIDSPSQWSTPRDLAWLASFDLRNPSIRKRMSTVQATIQSIGGRTTTLENTHELLHEPGPVIAGKTGTTGEAGQCLLSLVQEGSRDYIVVLLGSRERYADMRVVLAALASLFS